MWEPTRQLKQAIEIAMISVVIKRPFEVQQRCPLWGLTTPKDVEGYYPHGESHFPESVSLVLDWEMDSERKRKMFWDNAIRFYARAPV